MAFSHLHTLHACTPTHTQKPHHPGNVQIVVFQALAVKLKCVMQQSADVFILCN